MCNENTKEQHLDKQGKRTGSRKDFLEELLLKAILKNGEVTMQAKEIKLWGVCSKQYDPEEVQQDE